MTALRTCAHCGTLGNCLCSDETWQHGPTGYAHRLLRRDPVQAEPRTRTSAVRAGVGA